CFRLRQATADLDRPAELFLVRAHPRRDLRPAELRRGAAHGQPVAADHKLGAARRGRERVVAADLVPISGQMTPTIEWLVQQCLEGVRARGFLFDAFGSTGVTGLNLWSILVAIVGSVVVLVIYHAVAGRRAA